MDLAQISRDKEQSWLFLESAPKNILWTRTKEL